MNSSILLLVRDEIALEGLQGITFDTLWIRLVDRSQFHALQQPDQIPVFREEEIKKASFQNIIFKITQNEAKKGLVFIVKFNLIINVCIGFDRECSIF